MQPEAASEPSKELANFSRSVISTLILKIKTITADMKPSASLARTCCRTWRGGFRPPLPPVSPSPCLAWGWQNTTQVTSGCKPLFEPPLSVKFAACKRNTKSRPHDVFASPGIHAGQGQLKHRSIRVEVLAHEVGVLRSTATSHRLPPQSERHA